MTVDDEALAALESLHRRLADLTIRLRLVAPGPNVYAALHTGDIDMGPDVLHTSVRTAVLAAHADRPGPASVTPALRVLLTQPPELLPLAEVPDSGSGTGSGEVIRSDGYILLGGQQETTPCGPGGISR